MRTALLVLFAVVAAAAQTATIEGRVVSSAGGEGVRRAKVTARRSGLALTVETNSSGLFRIDGLTPGVYQLSAGRSGFQSGSGRPFPIDAGAHLRDIVVTLTPLAVISGRIVDMDGDPLSGISVHAMRYAYVDGKRRLRPVRSVTSDDRGQYRLFDVPPGRYFIRAVRRSTGQVGRLSGFHPAAVDVSSAASVAVAPGEETRNIDVRAAERLYLVRIRVANAPHSELFLRPGSRPNIPMMLSSLMLRDVNFGPETITSRLLAGGIQETTLAPGGYVFTARQTDGQSQDISKSVRLALDVTDHDLDLTVELSPPLTLHGTVAGLAEPWQGVLRLELPDENERRFEGVTGSVENGRFGLKNVLRDRYLARISPPEGYFLQSLRFGSHELPSQLVDLTSADPGALEIRFSDDGAEIAGLALDSDDRPVAQGSIVLEPIAADWPDRVKTVRADDHGNFRIHDVAPGEYRIFGWNGDEPDESRAVNLKVEVNGEHRITLRIP